MSESISATARNKTPSGQKTFAEPLTEAETEAEVEEEGRTGSPHAAEPELPVDSIVIDGEERELAGLLAFLRLLMKLSAAIALIQLDNFL